MAGSEPAARRRSGRRAAKTEPPGAAAADEAGAAKRTARSEPRVRRKRGAASAAAAATAGDGAEAKKEDDAVEGLSAEAAEAAPADGGEGNGEALRGEAWKLEDGAALGAEAVYRTEGEAGAASDGVAGGGDMEGARVEERASGDGTGKRAGAEEPAAALAAAKAATAKAAAAKAAALAAAKAAALSALAGAARGAEGAKRPRGKAGARRGKAGGGGGGRRNGDGVQGEDGVEAAVDAVDGEEAAAEYVREQVEVPDGFGELGEVLARFAASGQPGDVDSGEDGGGRGKEEAEGREAEADAAEAGGGGGGDSGGGGGDGEGEVRREDAAASAPSARQIRKKKRLSVAQLKALVRDPAVVEQWDVTAADPLLLVHLKALYGSVAVPANWRQKRKYLQSKRGMEKLPFKMPQFIEDTGIGAARTALAEADAAKTAKQKGRERIRPKAAGKGVDIDYSVMRDAFFKFQTKPRLTGHGDLYYELREREVQHERFRPGVLSATLREALGVGPDDPPPWLVAMQRYGPPPSYPELEIPGLNAPLPPGAAYGYHAGGWGKPPVDAAGRPLYGDAFGEGVRYGAEDSRFDTPPAARSRLWGEPAAAAAGVSAGPAGDDDDEATAAAVARRHDYVGEDDAAATAAAAAPPTPPAPPPPPETPAVGGVETPAGGMELRKGLAPGQLYSVLEPRAASVGAGALLGSSHVYDVGGAGGAGAAAAAPPREEGAKKRRAAAEAADGAAQKRKREEETKDVYKF